MKLQRIGLLILSLLAASTASAHVGHLHQDTLSNFTDGLLHPLTGFDHLLAMLTVGIYGAVSASSRRAALLAPLSFASLLLVGAGLGTLGMTLPAIEPMIAVSVLVLGLLLVLRKTLPLAASSALIGLFALFHGVAHGSEIPATAQVGSFISGMMLMTLTLHVCGLLLGDMMRKQPQLWTRVAGSAVALAGFGLLLQAV
jgi:urease accessory protein